MQRLAELLRSHFLKHNLELCCSISLKAAEKKLYQISDEHIARFYLQHTFQRKYSYLIVCFIEHLSSGDFSLQWNLVKFIQSSQKQKKKNLLELRGQSINA